MNRDTSRICTLAKSSKSTILLKSELESDFGQREAYVRKWSGIRLGLTPETTSWGLSWTAHSYRVLRSAWTVEMRLLCTDSASALLTASSWTVEIFLCVLSLTKPSLLNMSSYFVCGTAVFGGTVAFLQDSARCWGVRKSLNTVSVSQKIYSILEHLDEYIFTSLYKSFSFYYFCCNVTIRLYYFVH